MARVTLRCILNLASVMSCDATKVPDNSGAWVPERLNT